MQIEDGEVIFGKRWNQWTHEEKREFARCMEVEDLKYAIYLNWALEFLPDTRPEVQAFVMLLTAGSEGAKA